MLLNWQILVWFAVESANVGFICRWIGKRWEKFAVESANEMSGIGRWILKLIWSECNSNYILKNIQDLPQSTPLHILNPVLNFPPDTTLIVIFLSPLILNPYAYFVNPFLLLNQKLWTNLTLCQNSNFNLSFLTVVRIQNIFSFLQMILLIYGPATASLRGPC